MPLSTTLYGWVFTCEDMRGSATAIAPVVIKQVSLERMANFMEEYPMEGHTPDNPIIEKEVGDIIRAAGGHPNLVQYTDSFVEKQSLYLVMEYCADGDMYDYLSKRRQRNMSCLNALSVLSQVAAGLAFLHQHNIAHRDISLENIMLHRGRCKLGDFGLATRAGRGGGRQVGKDYYMAPEIVAGEPYDPKAADIWSLGIVFFIMLTGSPLFSQASMDVKAFRALKQAGVATVLESWGVANSMSKSALELMAGMLEIDPRKRLTVDQVLEHSAMNEYRVIQELSTTLYGWVFTCEDMRGSATAIAPVVIKQVSLERMANFMEEYPMEGHTPDNPIIEKEVGDIIRAAGGHPNLVQYTDSFVEKQSLYLVMEYCADGDMYDYLSKRRQRNMSCLNALSVLSQVAAGLAFLHQHNIAHRDISLENIMLHRGRCKLGDFGLATRAGRGGGRQVGKDYYMAPEIVAGEPYDPKAADIWSLGIVFFIMLTGSPLFSQASMSVKSFRALKQAGISTVLEAWGVADSMPLSAQHLVAGMLEIDPLKRLTIEQVIEHDAFNECLG
ncbi:Serine/threonine-protein kinase HSL1 [Phytophthora citrophthora]|uniref:Serine/threonine-protein kinase HSL1 n=1 Tax=Phytophthora citrophthora TaxID=4793 RepID=A0AAD9G9P7_9STRA|nr:Serine/threonine-protein kinase HSL1 [Phytophthora citrophthora]